MIGVCDAQRFGVHEGAGGWRFMGALTTVPTKVTPLAFNPNSGYPMMEAPTAGDPWGWNYESETGSPGVYAIVNNLGVPQYIWEGDSRVAAWEETETFPIYRYGITRSGGIGVSIVTTGGKCVKILYTSQEFIDDIEVLVAAASVPAWIANTKYSNITSASTLLNVLFLSKQGRYPLTMYSRTDLETRYMSAAMRYLYDMLYLRSASQILYNHAGETLIPLIKAQYTADMTTDEAGIIVFP